MTKEQLAELEKWVPPHGHQWECDAPDCDGSPLLGRLLEERDRLLEGASNVRVSLLMLLENPDDPPTPATLAEYATLLGNAIRFAEEAAR